VGALMLARAGSSDGWQELSSQARGIQVKHTTPTRLNSAAVLNERIKAGIQRR